MAFYDADLDEKLLVNLFTGWGYNFYRVENQLRADDLMIRARVCDMLGSARAALAAAEAAYRHEFLRPPTRGKTYGVLCDKYAIATVRPPLVSMILSDSPRS